MQLSADGQPVVIHDIRIDRTTNGAGPVSRLTAEQLGSLDAGTWFEQRLAVRPRVRAMAERAAAIAGGKMDFSSEAVPTLERVLALLARTSLSRIYIELKSDPTNRETLLRAVVSLVRASHLEREVTLLSFDHEIVRLAKTVASDIRAAATFPTAGKTLVTARSIIRSAERIGADETALHFGLATRRTVASLQESGLAVSVWTANSKILMRRLISVGVNSIITNFPNRLFTVLETPRTRDSKGRKLRRRR